MHSCLCCLQCPTDKDLTTPYTHRDRTEIYVNMLKDCFNIRMELDGWGSCGICSLCAGRLRDASDFKLQVQRCQAELRARSQPKTSVKDEPFGPGVAAGDGANDVEESVFQELRVKQEPATVDETELLEELPVKQEPATVDETELLGELPVKQEPATVDETALLDSERPVKSEVPDGAARAEDGPAREYCENEYIMQSSVLLRAESPVSLRARSQLAAACAVRLERLRESRTYCCDMCTQLFKDKSTLIRHIRTHNRCQLCNKTFIMSSCLSRHEPNCTKNNQKKCLLSERSTLSRGHVEKVLYSCDECSEGFRVKSVLRKHIQRNHIGEHLLNNSHRSLYKRPKHHSQMSSTNNKPFHCSDCAYKTSDRSNLKKHQRIHTGEKPFKCGYCDYKSGVKTHLQSHQKVHTGEKPFKCGYCDYKCSVKSSLKIHQTRHTGEKPFKCGYCDYKSGVKKDLKQHQIIHTGEKKFKCDDCEYRCSRKSTLHMHQRIHTGEKPFKCGYCEYRCSGKSRLLTHQRIHTGEKPFKCGYCDYKSSFKSTLKRHQKIHIG